VSAVGVADVLGLEPLEGGVRDVVVAVGGVLDLVVEEEEEREAEEAMLRRRRVSIF